MSVWRLFVLGVLESPRVPSLRRSGLTKLIFLTCGTAHCSWSKMEVEVVVSGVLILGWSGPL